MTLEIYRGPSPIWKHRMRDVESHIDHRDDTFGQRAMETYMFKESHPCFFNMEFLYFTRNQLGLGHLPC